MFAHLLLATLGPGDLWYAVPLIVAVSLVYAATRHEQTNLILRHALHTAVWITGLMAGVFVVLWLVTWMV
ncbi:MAG TPA: hypothetical protein VJL29_06080 [Thermoguttaceae bacterium]|nr:hypothetical protein [Thermoguttaceae bacterium]